MLSARSLRQLPPAVWALGMVSLLTDVASDMVYPLMPQLLAGLGGAPALGVVEGVAELLSSVVKAWAGNASDRGGRRGRFVVIGYGIAALARPCMAWVTAPWQVVATRSLDRLGKGLRSAPRDAILGAVTPPAHRGLAFGVHRAMDNLGAVIGGGTAWILLQYGHLTIRHVFIAAIVPGLASTALAIAALRREPRAAEYRETDALALERAPSHPLPRKVRAFLVAVAFFALGGSADSFLMARMGDLHAPIALIPLTWISLQLAKSILNVPGGWLADRLGPRRVAIVSWALYAAAYLAFAAAGTWWMLCAIFPLYALHYGLGEGAEKSLMARLCPADRRGAAFGWQHAVHGAALLPANVAFGLAYAGNPRAAFVMSATFAALGALLLTTLISRADEEQPA